MIIKHSDHIHGLKILARDMGKWLGSKSDARVRLSIVSLLCRYHPEIETKESDDNEI